MSGIASYNTTVLKTGITTSMTSEAMSTNSTLANTYKINTTSRRIWDRDISFTFFEATSTGGRVAIPSSELASVDYLFGKVTFTVSQTTPITVSGSFLPTANVAGANSYTLSQTAEMLDDTDFSNAGWRSRSAGLKDVTLTVSRWDSIDLDYFSLINNGALVVAEIRPGGSGSSVAARGFFRVETEARSGDVSALEAAELTFMLDQSTNADFGWGVP